MIELRSAQRSLDSGDTGVNAPDDPERKVQIGVAGAAACAAERCQAERLTVCWRCRELKSMTCVQVTDSLRQDAGAIATARFTSGLYNRFGATDGLRKERAFIGALGEVAFESILLDRAVPFESDIRAALEPDDGDFFLPGRIGLSVDVKIAKSVKTPAPQWRFGIPVDQHPASKGAIVIGWWNPTTDMVCFYGSLAGGVLAGRRVVRANSLTGEPYFTDNVELRWGELDQSFGHLPGFRS